jgi:hypothetical protein
MKRWLYIYWIVIFQAISLQFFAQHTDSVESHIYRVENLDINTASAEISMQPFKNGFLFISDRTSRGTSRKDEVFCFYYKPNTSEKKGLARRLRNMPVIPVNIGPYTILTQGIPTIYFTRNTDISNTDTITNRLAIYFINVNKRRWIRAQPFEYNSSAYSVGHPSISANGKWLFFVSDMPGGYGGTDLYLCRKINNKWSKPENLGDKINTKGNEMFPFIHPDGRLYFSSDSLAGYGGLDIFQTSFNGNSWDTPVNLNQPINSRADDFAFYSDSTLRTIFLASNRPGGRGSDDVYSYTLDTTKLQRIEAFVTDKAGLPLENVRVTITREHFALEKFVTPYNGSFSFWVEPGSPCKLELEKIGFVSKILLSPFFEGEVNENKIHIELEKD